VQFLILCGVLAIAIMLLRPLILRKATLAAANLAFVATIVPTKRSAALLAVFVVTSYLALRMLRDRPTRALIATTIGLATVAFLVVKRYTFIEWVLPANVWRMVPEVIGISYMLFKFIHIVVDQAQGQLAPYTIFSYANYQLLFFTITAGPIQRYNEFYEYWSAVEAPLPDGRKTLSAWSRLFTGMIKLGLLAPLAWDFFDESQTGLLREPETQVLERFTVFFYSYPVFMYLNFSGYTDIVVAAARLIGLTLPENFNRPYLARNVIDFWNRWHISLTHWIRDYVFMTSYKACATCFPMRSKELGYGLLFFSLFLAGVWHGSTAGFVVFGAIHGFGAAANRFYGDALKSWLGRERFKRYEKSRLIKWFAVLLTIHFVCFAFIFFSSGVQGAFGILQAVGRSLVSGPASVSSSRHGYFGSAFAVGVPLLLLATWYRDSILAQVDDLRQRVGARDWSLYASFIAKTVFVVFMLICLWGLHKEPEIAYMRF
jgi:D-alanyl-lipoteichoic acid acyltransferase DltB (MBOAT superfamily)